MAVMVVVGMNARPGTVSAIAFAFGASRFPAGGDSRCCGPEICQERNPRPSSHESPRSYSCRSLGLQRRSETPATPAVVSSTAVTAIRRAPEPRKPRMIHAPCRPQLLQQ
jgi:hypothetical protein